jgi:hypothetical protein
VRSRWTESHSGWTSPSLLGGTGCATSHTDADAAGFYYARRTGLTGVSGVRGGSPSRQTGLRMRLALSVCVTVAALETGCRPGGRESGLMRVQRLSYLVLLRG